MTQANQLRKKIKFFCLSFLLLALTFPALPLAEAQEAVGSKSGRFSMSYVYFGSPSTYTKQVDNSKGSLQVVSPNYFDINKEGNLEITWKLQTSFITEMKSRGIKVVPFLSNHWSKTAGVNGLENREKLAQDIADAIKEYQLDGVNVDIEGVGHEYRDAFTDFVRLIRAKVPAWKEVSVAVAANPNDWKKGWHGFYDYTNLAKYSDYLMIMAYDESWDGSDTGPVASISFVNRSIVYALNKGVPKSKIVLGLPFYGRIWKMDSPYTSENVRIMGKGVSSVRVKTIAQKFNGKEVYDDYSQSARVTFTIPKGEYYYLANTKLTAGDYMIWYDNERSLKEKLKLINFYDIKGAGSWSLNQEEPGLWEYYSLYLNGRLYKDVPSGYWAEDNIFKVNEKGWMSGMSATKFEPNGALTRAQGAAILVRALGLDKKPPQEYLFKDAQGHWAQKSIELAREYEMLSGTAPGTFSPNAPLTREQLAAILNNIFQFQMEQAENSTFPDVPEDRWSYHSVVAMKANGIIGGFNDGTFRPRDSSSRAQMAALMIRLSQLIEQKRMEYFPPQE